MVSDHTPTWANLDYRPDPQLLKLGEGFFDPVDPAHFPEHRLRFRNDRWAKTVGLAGLGEAAWEEHFARFVALPHNLPQPLAMRYHGHQFDQYNPDLGDGRGFTFAQLRDQKGRLLDLGTKGSGPTPWSRGGDGKLTLKGGMREVLATELLEALGVETSKSFSLFETGEQLHRGDEPSPTRSAVLVRLGHSHMRVGSFQRQAALERPDAIRELMEHCVSHYYPQLEAGPGLPQRFLSAFSARAAELCAQWLVAGFVHGVLNSDNQNIAGESFDYGPWRFLPNLDLRFTAAYFDHQGLYAFGRQPQAVANNVARLGVCLRLIEPDLDIESVVSEFGARLEQAHTRGLLWRLGLEPRDAIADTAVAQATLQLLGAPQVGYAALFHDLFGGADGVKRAQEGKRREHYPTEGLATLERALEGHATRKHDVPAALQDEDPCDLLIDEVEALWDPIDQQDDWTGCHAKIAAIRRLGEALA